MAPTNSKAPQTNRTLFGRPRKVSRSSSAPPALLKPAPKRTAYSAFVASLGLQRPARPADEWDDSVRFRPADKPPDGKPPKPTAPKRRKTLSALLGRNATAQPSPRKLEAQPSERRRRALPAPPPAPPDEVLPFLDRTPPPVRPIKGMPIPYTSPTSAGSPEERLAFEDYTPPAVQPLTAETLALVQTSPTFANTRAVVAYASRRPLAIEATTPKRERNAQFFAAPPLSATAATPPSARRRTDAPALLADAPAPAPALEARRSYRLSPSEKKGVSRLSDAEHLKARARAAVALAGESGLSKGEALSRHVQRGYDAVDVELQRARGGLRAELRNLEAAAAAAGAAPSEKEKARLAGLRERLQYMHYDRLAALLDAHVSAMRGHGAVFDHVFEEPRLGLSISLARYGNRGRRFVAVDETFSWCAIFPGPLKPTDELVAINDEVIVEPVFEDMLATLAGAPRPLKLTFVMGERRHEAFREQQERRGMAKHDRVRKTDDGDAVDRLLEAVAARLSGLAGLARTAKRAAKRAADDAQTAARGSTERSSGLARTAATAATEARRHAARSRVLALRTNVEVMADADAAGAEVGRETPLHAPKPLHAPYSGRAAAAAALQATAQAIDADARDAEASATKARQAATLSRRQGAALAHILVTVGAQTATPWDDLGHLADVAASFDADVLDAAAELDDARDPQLSIARGRDTAEQLAYLGREARGSALPTVARGAPLPLDVISQIDIEIITPPPPEQHHLAERSERASRSGARAGDAWPADARPADDARKRRSVDKPRRHADERGDDAPPRRTRRLSFPPQPPAGPPPPQAEPLADPPLADPPLAEPPLADPPLADPPKARRRRPAGPVQPPEAGDSEDGDSGRGSGDSALTRPKRRSEEEPEKSGASRPEAADMFDLD